MSASAACDACSQHQWDVLMVSHGSLLQCSCRGATKAMPSSKLIQVAMAGAALRDRCKTCLRSRVSTSDSCKPSSVLPWQTNTHCSDIMLWAWLSIPGRWHLHLLYISHLGMLLPLWFTTCRQYICTTPAKPPCPTILSTHQSVVSCPYCKAAPGKRRKNRVHNNCLSCVFSTELEKILFRQAQLCSAPLIHLVLLTWQGPQLDLKLVI